jgi:paraquat-inducible protein A
MTIACPDCGTLQTMPKLAGRGRALCRRCHRVLERAQGRSVDAALALALTTLLLLFPANLATLLRISAVGITRSSRLGSGVIAMWGEGYPLMAVVVGLQGVLLPFLRFGLLAAVLASVRLRAVGRWTGPAFRWAERLDLWAMPDVFLFGAAIGYSRVAPFVPATIGAGGWCLIAAALASILARASLDRRAVWRMIAPPPVLDVLKVRAVLSCTECDLPVPGVPPGSACPRCAAALWPRKPFSLMRATALVIAGAALYPMANYFPMSVQDRLGTVKLHTIAAGVMDLVGAGLWPLAAIIFTASIGIPMLKLLAMSWLIWSAHRGSTRRLATKSRLYRVVHEIGRWSNIDVFTLAIFVPLFQLGSFVHVSVGLGAPAFLAVIVLTMLAVRVFDPRLLWDAAEARA